MALIEILKPDFSFDDNRGNITQICSGGFNQINAVFTKKGSIRGNMHYHKENEEAFYIIAGKIKLTVKDDTATEEYTFSSGDLFMVPRFIKHTFEYLEDTYLVGLYSGCVEKTDGTKDIISDEE